MNNTEEILANSKEYHRIMLEDVKMKAAIDSFDANQQELISQIFTIAFCNGIEFFGMKHEKLIDPKTFREKLEVLNLAVGNFF